MLTLVFDTETTGLPKLNEDYRLDLQPDVVQIGASLFDETRVYSEVSIMVKPFIHPMNPHAAAANGLTTEMVNTYGSDPIEAAMSLLSLIRMADRIFGHNIAFDIFLIRTMLHRCQQAKPDWGFDPLELAFKPDGSPRPMYCTMQSLTEECGLRKANGAPKWPKLVEAYRHVTGSEMEGAHDALCDVRGTVTLVKFIDAKGIEPWRL